MQASLLPLLTLRVSDLNKRLKAVTHQTEIKELAMTKASGVDASCCLASGPKSCA